MYKICLAMSTIEKNTNNLKSTDHPFEYEVLDNFLAEEELERLSKFYNSLTFLKKHSDLFKFTQSFEISNEDELMELKAKLNELFQEKMDLKSTYYNIFASYYEKGDFLLCHDDMVDERAYAFTFYIDDFDSGKLILYENDCKTTHKIVDVKRNRLVIFQVCAKSYHEVDYCIESGRKAISGWINVPGKKQNFNLVTHSFSVGQNIEYFDLEVDIENEDYLMLEFEDIELSVLSSELQGPFLYRRCLLLEYDIIYVPRFKNYTLIHVECLEVFKSGYIMCNDKINDESADILDVFIFKCDGDYKDFLIYVNKSSEISFTVDAMGGNMIILKRLNHSICIHRATKKVCFKHFMYKKQ